MKRILPILLGLPFLAVGLWLLATLVGALNLLREARAEWVRVPATVIAHESIPIGIHQRFHRPTVRYIYTFEGQRFESTRHDLLEKFPVVSTSIGRRGKLPYAVGQTVMAYVDPKEPFDSVLSLELQYATLLGPLALICLLVGGSFVIGPFLATERRPRFGLGVLTAVAGLITLMTGLLLSEAGAWSIPAAIVVAASAAGTVALARLVFRHRTGRT